MHKFVKNTLNHSYGLNISVKFFIFLIIFTVTLAGLMTYSGMSRPEKVEAAVSSNLNYQGRLLSSNGNVVPDGYYNLEFKIYNAATAGSNLWTERYHDTNGATAGGDNRVRVVNGYFSVNLGSVTPFPNMNWDQDLWMTLNIGGSAQTATPTFDGEMAPRIKLTAVPYAFQAKSAEQLARTVGSHLGVLQLPSSLDGNTVYNLINPGLAYPSVDICLSSGNCAGSGGGLIGGGTANRISVFTSANGLGNSYLLQGTNSLTLDSGVSLTVDTDTLFADAVNHRLGVGTVTPAYKLDVVSSEPISAKFSGRVIAANAVNDDELVTLEQLNSAIGGTGSILQGGNTFGEPIAIGTNDNYGFSIKTNNTTRFSIDNAGASTFNATLTVGGTLYAGGAGVSLTGPDGGISKTYTTSGTVNQNDVLIMVNSGGVKVATSTTPRDTRVLGVYRGGSGTSSGSVGIAGNSTVNATSDAVSIGDQLVVSSEAGRVMVDNNATAGILGYATTAKAAGSPGLVGVRIQIVNGNTAPYFRTSDFRIQNAAGSTDLLRVDAASNRIAIGPGAVPANGILTIGTNTTNAANGLYFGTDTNLYRSVTGSTPVLRSNNGMWLSLGSPASIALQSSGAAGDVQPRFQMLADGTMRWGDGTTTYDANLYRSAANLLQTDWGLNVIGTLTENGQQVCLVSGNCAGTGGNGDVLQGGNTFGVPMVIGTNNNQTLSFETNGNTVATFNIAGQLQLAATGINGGIIIGNDANANLYRSSAGTLSSNAVIQATRFRILTDSGNFDGRGADNGGRARYISGVTGDTNSLGRFYISAVGGLNWGNGTDAPDVNLYRPNATANTLRTNGTFLIDNKLAVGPTNTPLSKLLVNDSAGSQSGWANTAIMGVSATDTTASNALILHNGVSPLLQVKGNGSTSIGAGAVPGNGVLTVGTDTTNAAGGIYFGTDTSANLYRSGNGYLRTNANFQIGGSNLNILSNTGTITFGTGSDVNLYRAGANTLATDDSFQLVGAGSNLTVQGTGTSSFAGNLHVAGGITTGGFSTSSTGSAFAGQYTKLASCTITTQFGDCRMMATVASVEDGGSEGSRARIDFRVKQQAAMESAPTVNVRVTDTMGTINVSHFSAVTTVNSSGSTVVELYGQIASSYQMWKIAPILTTARSASGTPAWFASQPLMVSLPAGAQFAASYDNVVANNITATGSIQSAGNMISGGTLQANGTFTLAGGGMQTITTVGNQSLRIDPNGTGRIELQVADTYINASGEMYQNGNKVCDESGNCAGSGGMGDILQNGNAFNADMVIGTNDNYNLSLETGGTIRATLTTTGMLQLATQGVDGGLQIGGDAYLYRSASNTLRTDGGLIVGGQLTAGGLLNATGTIIAQRTNAGDRALDVKLISDAGPRLRVTANGNIAFGDGTGLLDVTLSRTAGNQLSTGSIFSANSYVSSAGLYTAHNNTGTTVEFRSGFRDTAGNTGAANFRSGANTSTGNTGAVNINSGNASGGNSGNVVIDTGTASGTAGAITLGATNASSTTIGRSGTTVTLQGSTTAVTGNLILSGSQFTNNASTLNTALVLGNFPTGGAVGTAAATVDIKTALSIGQTTAGQTLSLPSPTSTAAGRVVYILNTGTASFTMHGISIPSGYGQIYVWNGTAWILGASGGGSAITLQGAYDGGNIITTTDAKNISFTLADTATDSNFLVNIATGSSGRFAIRNDATDIMSINSTGKLLLSTQGSNGGILIGGDANLFRSGSNTLSTSGAFVAYNADANQVALGRTASAVAGAGITFGSAQDTNLYRSAANILATDDSFSILGVGSRLYVQDAASTSVIEGNLTVNGNLNVRDFNRIQASSLMNTYYASMPSALAQSPIGRSWHDIFAFNRLNGTPTFEQSPDGSTWNAATLNSNVFAQTEYTNVGILDGVTNTSARYTWNSANLQYATNSWGWLVAKMPYTSATAANKTILVESSADGVTWTARANVTGIASQQQAIYMPVQSWGSHTRLRVTITSTNGQPIVLSGLQMLTDRVASQGGGREYEIPYTWDASMNLVAIGSGGSTGALRIGTSATTSPTNGLYFHNDVNLYRGGNNLLTTDDDFNIQGGGLRVNGTEVITNGRVLQNVTANTNILTSGTLADARLNTRIGTVAATITDWNSAVSNGWYMGNNATNAPGPNWYMGEVQVHNASYVTQTVHNFAGVGLASNTQTYRRHMQAGVWGTWYKLQISQAEQDARYIQSADLNGYVQLQSTTPGTAQTGHININGTVRAGGFTGSGANLTNLNADEITDGKLNNARLNDNVAILDRNSQTFAGNNQVFRNAANSTTAFSIQNSGSETLFNADTVNQRINIGNAVSSAKLTVSGDFTDASVWTPQTPPEYNGWTSVAYGNGLFVAVAQSGTNRVMTSPDGITWTARTVPANDWRSVTYGNGLFVAVSSGNNLMTSPDGITWTTRMIPSGTWYSVTYGNGLFVAVSSTSSNQIITSSDGITWTARTVPQTNSRTSVTYGNGLFVAVSYDGANRVMTSPDGINWTLRTAAAANTWFSVTYGNGLFVAVSYDGANRVMTSPDGITWTSQAAGSANSWRSVTYGNGLFVAAADSGTNRVMTSPDGITWTGRDVGPVTWQNVSYGQGLFLIVSDTGGVWTSPGGYQKAMKVNGDVDVSGTIRQNGYEVCTTAGNCKSGGTGDILQGGNAFGVAMVLGTNDNFGLQFETNGTTRLTISNVGNATFTGTISTTGVSIGSGVNLITTNGNNQLRFAGTARNTKKIVLTPEYAGSVLNGSGVGTMTAGYDSTRRENYYVWSTTESSWQQYEVVITMAVPSDWSAWAASNSLSVNAYTNGAVNAGGNVTVIGTAGVTDINAGNTTPNGVWQTYNFNLNNARYTADGMMTIRLNMGSQSGGIMQLGNINLTYLSQY